MTNNEIKIQALKTAITMTREAVAKIAVVVDLVNAAWTNNGEPYPLPVGEYKRRAWLLADLTRMLDQIQKEVIEADLAAGRPVCEETGRDLREWCGNDIEAAHAEALEDDRKYQDAIKVIADNLTLPVWDGLRPVLRYEVIKAHHAEALEMNAMRHVAKMTMPALIERLHSEALEINNAIDRMIDEREHVSNCSYEDAVLLNRLANIGRGEIMGIEAKLGADFKDTRHKAMMLWANGFVTYPPEECGADYIAACVEIRAQWAR